MRGALTLTLRLRLLLHVVVALVLLHLANPDRVLCHAPHQDETALEYHARHFHPGVDLLYAHVHLHGVAYDHRRIPHVIDAESVGVRRSEGDDALVVLAVRFHHPIAAITVDEGAQVVADPPREGGGE